METEEEDFLLAIHMCQMELLNSPKADSCYKRESSIKSPPYATSYCDPNLVPPPDYNFKYELV